MQMFNSEDSSVVSKNLNSYSVSFFLDIADSILFFHNLHSVPRPNSITLKLYYRKHIQDLAHIQTLLLFVHYAHSYCILFLLQYTYITEILILMTPASCELRDNRDQSVGFKLTAISSYNSLYFILCC